MNIACIVFCDDGVELFIVECVEKLWSWIVHELNVSEVVCVGGGKGQELNVSEVVCVGVECVGVEKVKSWIVRGGI
jgi:hypothetical protein